eukprot:1887190-Pleurochrysis_carterae.AAC.1
MASFMCAPNACVLVACVEYTLAFCVCGMACALSCEMSKEGYGYAHQRETLCAQNSLVQLERAPQARQRRKLPHRNAERKG